MSADNTILIATFPSGKIRVAHVQAVENLDDNPVFTERSTDLCRFVTLCDSPVFYDHDLALNYAVALHDKIEEDGGYVEYGITSVAFDRELIEGITLTQAMREIATAPDPYYDTAHNQFYADQGI
jgi:hypothetical protein